jgi:hypothetical protein
MDNANSTPNRAGSPNGPIPVDNGAGAPIPLADAGASATANVSRAPLNLGGGVSTPAAPRPPAPRPAPDRPPTAPAAADRITACKTFFTKLHPGAMIFLDEQVAKWLRENPQIVIKLTNVFQGEITEKKTEPSIVIVVWY